MLFRNQAMSLQSVRQWLHVKQLQEGGLAQDVQTGLLADVKAQFVTAHIHFKALSGNRKMLHYNTDLLINKLKWTFGEMDLWDCSNWDTQEEVWKFFKLSIEATLKYDNVTVTVDTCRCDCCCVVLFRLWINVWMRSAAFIPPRPCYHHTTPFRR